MAFKSPCKQHISAHEWSHHKNPIPTTYLKEPYVLKRALYTLSNLHANNISQHTSGDITKTLYPLKRAICTQKSPIYAFKKPVPTPIFTGRALSCKQHISAHEWWSACRDAQKRTHTHTHTHTHICKQTYTHTHVIE